MRKIEISDETYEKIKDQLLDGEGKDIFTFSDNLEYQTPADLCSFSKRGLSLGLSDILDYVLKKYKKKYPDLCSFNLFSNLLIFLLT